LADPGISSASSKSTFVPASSDETTLKYEVVVVSSQMRLAIRNAGGSLPSPALPPAGDAPESPPVAAVPAEPLGSPSALSAPQAATTSASALSVIREKLLDRRQSPLLNMTFISIFRSHYICYMDGVKAAFQPN
jgi:hypothetical protein